MQQLLTEPGSSPHTIEVAAHRKIFYLVLIHDDSLPRPSLAEQLSDACCMLKVAVLRREVRSAKCSASTVGRHVRFYGAHDSATGRQIILAGPR